jgi:hypothetical protein
MPLPYTTGTIAVTNASADFVGDGTAWALNQIQQGWLVVIGTEVNAVDTITDDTHGTFLLPWAGSTASGQSYAIIPVRYDALVTQAAMLQALQTLQNILAGSGLTFDNATSDANPGNGKFRANNASLASATTLYICKTDALGEDISAFLASLDDSNNSVKGNLILARQSDGGRAYYNVGAVTDATGYIKLAVSNPSGVTSFLAGDQINLQFYRSGDSDSSARVLFNHSFLGGL